MSRSIRPLSRAAVAVSIALLLPAAALAFNPQPEPPKGKANTKPGSGQAAKGIIIIDTKAPKSAK